MSIPNAALQKVRNLVFPECHALTANVLPQLLQEVESQAVLSQQQISQTHAEINSKKRDARLNDLTSKELSQLARPATVYEGVGKMRVNRAAPKPRDTLWRLTTI
jgi:chaperonin cofactor prefoldin